MSLLPKNTFPFREVIEPLTPETLAKLDLIRVGVGANRALSQTYITSEIEDLPGLKVIISASGVFWNESEQKFPPNYGGVYTEEVKNPISVIEDGGFLFGGEQLAQAILAHRQAEIPY